MPIVDLLIWLRVPGDTIFAIGALILAIFIAGLWIFPRREDEQRMPVGEECEGLREGSPGLNR